MTASRNGLAHTLPRPSMLIRIVILFVTGIQCAQLCNQHISPKYFRMTPPSKMFIELGTYVDVTCGFRMRRLNRLETARCDRALILGNMELSLNGNMLAEEDENINVTSMVVGTSTRLMSAGRHVFQCHYNNKTIESVVIYAYNIPKPKKLVCICDNLKSMSCNWRLFTNEHLAPWTWGMSFRRSKKGPWAPMPASSYSLKNNRTCDWVSVTSKREGVVFLVVDVYQVRVTVVSRFGNHSKIVSFSPWDILKPRPVSSLDVTKMATYSVTLKWSPPPLSTRHWPRIVYSVVLLDHDGGDRRRESTKETTVTFQHVFPYHRYSAEVRCKSNSSKDLTRYWSDGVLLNLTTPQDIPRQSVTMAAGSYTLVECGVQELCPVLYWTNPNPRNSGGPLVRYEVASKPVNVSSPAVYSVVRPEDGPWTHEEVVGPTVTTVMQRSLLKDQSYVVIVKAATVIGSSDASSQMFIPDYDTGSKLKAKWVAIEDDAGGNRVRMTWEAEACSDIRTLTFYTCDLQTSQLGNATKHVNCQDIIWIMHETEGTCGKDNFTWLEKPDHHNQDVKYGVSMATLDGISGGIVWQTHMFESYNGVPTRPHYTAQGLSSQEGTDSQSVINVTMTYAVSGVNNGGLPKVHHVFYKEHADDKHVVCPEDGAVVQVPVDLSKPYITLTNVEPGSRYIVCVKSSNEVGSSVFGEPVLIKLYQEEDTTYILVVGIAGTVMVMVLLVIFVTTGVKRWKRFVHHRSIIINVDEFEQVATAFLEKSAIVKSEVDIPASSTKRKKRISEASKDSGIGTSLDNDDRTSDDGSLPSVPSSEHYNRIGIDKIDETGACSEEDEHSDTASLEKQESDDVANYVTECVMPDRNAANVYVDQLRPTVLVNTDVIRKDKEKRTLSAYVSLPGDIHKIENNQTTQQYCFFNTANVSSNSYARHCYSFSTPQVVSDFDVRQIMSSDNESESDVGDIDKEKHIQNVDETDDPMINLTQQFHAATNPCPTNRQSISQKETTSITAGDTKAQHRAEKALNAIPQVNDTVIYLAHCDDALLKKIQVGKQEEFKLEPVMHVAQTSNTQMDDYVKHCQETDMNESQTSTTQMKDYAKHCLKPVIIALPQSTGYALHEQVTNLSADTERSTLNDYVLYRHATTDTNTDSSGGSLSHHGTENNKDANIDEVEVFDTTNTVSNDLNHEPEHSSKFAGLQTNGLQTEMKLTKENPFPMYVMGQPYSHNVFPVYQEPLSNDLSKAEEDTLVNDSVQHSQATSLTNTVSENRDQAQEIILPEVTDYVKHVQKSSLPSQETERKCNAQADALFKTTHVQVNEYVQHCHVQSFSRQCSESTRDGHGVPSDKTTNTNIHCLKQLTESERGSSRIGTSPKVVDTNVFDYTQYGHSTLLTSPTSERKSNKQESFLTQNAKADGYVKHCQVVESENAEEESKNTDSPLPPANTHVNDYVQHWQVVPFGK